MTELWHTEVILPRIVPSSRVCVCARVCVKKNGKPKIGRLGEPIGSRTAWGAREPTGAWWASNLVATFFFTRTRTHTHTHARAYGRDGTVTHRGHFATYSAIIACVCVRVRVCVCDKMAN